MKTATSKTKPGERKGDAAAQLSARKSTGAGPRPKVTAEEKSAKKTTVRVERAEFLKVFPTDWTSNVEIKKQILPKLGITTNQYGALKRAALADKLIERDGRHNYRKGSNDAAHVDQQLETPNAASAEGANVTEVVLTTEEAVKDATEAGDTTRPQIEFTQRPARKS
jgi:hypothetical protein